MTTPETADMPTAALARAGRALPLLALMLTCACAATDDASELGVIEPAASEQPDASDQAAATPAARAPSDSSTQAAPGLAPARDLPSALAELLPAGDTSLVIDHVRLTGSPVAGSLAAHLHQLLSQAASARPGVTLVSRDAQDEILSLLVMWTSDAYAPDSLPELGRLQSASHLLRCSFVELDDPPRVRLSLELAEIETGVTRAAALELPRASLPRHLSAEPSNRERIAATLAAWERELPRSAFALELWTDRGVGASYAPGESMRVFVRSGRAGTLSLEWLDAQGQSARFFPNAMHGDDHIGAVGVLEIPDDSMAFELSISAGRGSEVLRAVVTAEDGSRAQALCGFRIVSAD